jgi:hypothetical protein
MGSEIYLDILECKEILTHLKKLLGKSESILKFSVMLDAICLTYTNARDYERATTLVEQFNKKYNRFIRFWITGERRSKFIKKQNKVK